MKCFTAASRRIRAIYYDEKRELMAVETWHGHLRLYAQVPAHVPVDIVGSPSPGLRYDDYLGTAALARRGLSIDPRWYRFLREVRVQRRALAAVRMSSIEQGS